MSFTDSAKHDTAIAMATAVARLALEQPASAATETDAIQTRIEDLRGTTKENITWRRGTVLESGRIGTYVHHDGKTDVAVQTVGDE